MYKGLVVVMFCDMWRVYELLAVDGNRFFYRPQRFSIRISRFRLIQRIAQNYLRRELDNAFSVLKLGNSYS